MANICFVSLAAPPTVSSHAQRVLYCIKELYESGHNVKLVTRKFSEDIKNTSTMWKELNKYCSITEVDTDIKRRLVDKVSQLKLNSNILLRARQSLRAYYRSKAIPDTYSSLIKHIVEAISEKIKNEENFDLLISSGAPFSAHVAASKISKLFGIPLVLDYGDPWVLEPGRPRKYLRKWYEKSIEQRVLDQADKVFFTTKETLELYLNNYDISGDKLDVMLMGHDPVEFSAHKHKRSNSRVLDIVYAGRINEEYRDSTIIKDLIESIIKRNLEDRIHISFYGDELDSVSHKLMRYIHRGIVSIHSSVEHKQYLDKINNSNGLIVFGNNSRYQIPGKIAHYLATGNPILYFKNLTEDVRDPSWELMESFVNDGIFLASKEGIDRFIDYVLSGRRLIFIDECCADIISWSNTLRPLVDFVSDLEKQ